MSNNTYTAKETSFWKFIQENEIEIPIIQRDYAQGRLGKESLRKNFLNDLKKALDNEKPYKDKAMKMDFVYGSVENKKMNPLDGQPFTHRILGAVFRYCACHGAFDILNLPLKCRNSAFFDSKICTCRKKTVLLRRKRKNTKKTCQLLHYKYRQSKQVGLSKWFEPWVGYSAEVRVPRIFLLTSIRQLRLLCVVKSTRRAKNMQLAKRKHAELH